MIKGYKYFENIFLILIKHIVFYEIIIIFIKLSGFTVCCTHFTIYPIIIIIHTLAWWCFQIKDAAFYLKHSPNTVVSTSGNI